MKRIYKNESKIQKGDNIKHPSGQIHFCVIDEAKYIKDTIDGIGNFPIFSESSEKSLFLVRLTMKRLS